MGALGPALARADEPEGPKLPGRVYASTSPRLEDVPHGIIAVDPNSGAWSSVDVHYSGGARISPDGRKAVVQVDLDRKFTHLVIDLVGAADPVRLPGRAGVTLWSADGKELLYSEVKGRNPSPRFASWSVRVDGTGQAELPVPDTELLEDASPDGSWLLFRSARGEDAGMIPFYWPFYARKRDGSAEWLVIPGGRAPERGGKPAPGVASHFYWARFAPDGKRIAYTESVVGAPMQLCLVDVSGEHRRKVAAMEAGESLQSICWSPDGKWLAGALWKKGEDDERPMPFGLLIAAADGPTIRRVPIVPVPSLWTVLDWRLVDGD